MRTIVDSGGAIAAMKTAEPRHPVVLAQRQATSLLLATDQDYRHVIPLTGHPYLRILPYDLDH